MPPREPSAYLIDLIEACGSIEAFIRDADADRYMTDKMLRSAVERQLLIVGEAVVHLRRLDDAGSQRLGPIRSIIAFRNILVHGYFSIDDRVVWEIAAQDAPRIRASAEAWLREIAPRK